MSLEQEVKLKIKKILGVAQPFKQGGSLRLTIPKRALKIRIDQDKVSAPTLEDKVDRSKKEYFALIFFETDRGILLLPFDRVLNPPNVRNALSFIDLSKISDEELEVLLEEE